MELPNRAHRVVFIIIIIRSGHLPLPVHRIHATKAAVVNGKNSRAVRFSITQEYYLFNSLTRPLLPLPATTSGHECAVAVTRHDHQVVPAAAVALLPHPLCHFVGFSVQCGISGSRVQQCL